MRTYHGKTVEELKAKLEPGFFVPHKITDSEHFMLLISALPEILDALEDLDNKEASTTLSPLPYRPYTCPNCQGETKITRLAFAEKRATVMCPTCKGEGVLWK